MAKVHIEATSENDDGKIRIYSKTTNDFNDYQPRFISKDQYKKLYEDLEQDITKSIKSSPELRKEIRRVFDMANKRIKRLEAADSTEVLSPALQGLNRAKFLVKDSNGDWNKLVGMYKEAVAFIRQGTSTVRGAREFTQHVKDTFMDVAASKYNKSEDQLEYLWKQSLENIQIRMENANAVTEVIKYQQIVQDVYSEAIATVASAIERDAILLQQQLEQDIEDTSRDLAHEIATKAVKGVDEAMQAFFEDWN